MSRWSVKRGARTPNGAGITGEPIGAHTRERLEHIVTRHTRPPVLAQRQLRARVGDSIFDRHKKSSTTRQLRCAPATITNHTSNPIQPKPNCSPTPYNTSTSRFRNETAARRATTRKPNSLSSPQFAVSQLS